MEKRKIVLEQAKKYDSFYLYDEKEILENTTRLTSHFAGVEFLYSLKTNPAQAILKTVFSKGFGADAASLAEVQTAYDFGVPQEKIQYSAPGKSLEEIAQALDISTLIADSLEEVSHIQALAEKRGLIAEIGIRINPNFTFLGEGGMPSKFGIDESVFFQTIPLWKEYKNIKIVGIHVHSRSQELNARVLENYYQRMLTLAASVQAALGSRLKFINMGSGLGIPYGREDTALDIAYLGKRTRELMKAFQKELSHAGLIVETGRYVVGQCGWYVTKVLDRKESMGTVFVILKNTLNGFIRPSLSRLVMSYAKDLPPMGSEPLFTAEDAFQCFVLNEETEMETVTLVGNLCTSTDVVAKDILLPKLKTGDVIVITNAGSYGAVLSPMQFSWQTPPKELFLRQDGSVIDA